MKNFNETGVVFTENEKMQIVNTILGFRNCFTYSIETIKREFVVGNVKFRFIITDNGEIVSVSVECAVKGTNGRYGNMLCYAYDEFNVFNRKPDVWKFRLVDIVRRDIFGDVYSNDVAPVSEGNVISNQIVNNIEDLNIPESFDTPETFVMGASYENDGCFQSCVEKYGDRFIDAVSVLWNKHLQLMTENYNILDDNDIMFGKYFSEQFIAFKESAIQFWNEVAEGSDKFQQISDYWEWYKADAVWYFLPCITENWEEYVEDWATGMVDDRTFGVFDSIDEVFDETDIYPMFEEFINNRYDYTNEDNIESIFNDIEAELTNPIEVFNKLVEESDKWVVIAKCSDGDIVIHKDGEIAFDIDIAGEIAKDHQNMGAEIEIMRYADYKEMFN